MARWSTPRSPNCSQMCAVPSSAATPSQAAAAAINGPDPGPVYIRPELISGGIAPKSNTASSSVGRDRGDDPGPSYKNYLWPWLRPRSRDPLTSRYLCSDDLVEFIRADGQQTL